MSQRNFRGICSRAINSGVTSPIKSPRLSLRIYHSLAVCQSRHFWCRRLHSFYVFPSSVHIRIYVCFTYTYLWHGRQQQHLYMANEPTETYCSPVLLLSAYKKYQKMTHREDLSGSELPPSTQQYLFIYNKLHQLSSYIGYHKILSKMQKDMNTRRRSTNEFRGLFFFWNLSGKAGSPPSNPSKSREGRRGLLLAFSFGNGGGAATTGYWTRRGTMGVLDLKLRGLVWLHNKLGVVVSFF